MMRTSRRAPSVVSLLAKVLPFSYFRRLTTAFGWRYVLAVILTYGANQGIGEKLVYTARKYFIFDGMGLDASAAGQLIGFSRIPWQLKSLFGVLSDVLPINGYHRGPYMLIAGILGVVASMTLAAFPAQAFMASTAAVVMLFSNINFAMPDVMIDATVAERAKVNPKRAADLQALCWGSLGVCMIPASIFKGYLLEWGGARLLFGLSIATSTCVALPPLLGWLGEKRHDGRCEVRQQCRRLMGTLAKRRVLFAAGMVGCYSFSLGTIQLLVAPLYPDAVGLGTLITNMALCVGLYFTLRAVDEVLARAVVFPFLRGALSPRSDVIFDWSHAPSHASSDDRCWTALECLSVRTNASAGVNSTDGNPMPCGWARSAGLPCLTPVFFAYVEVAGALALVGGTAAYTTCFQTWRYRSIIGLSQVLLLFANLIDWIWTSRYNLAIGIPDELMAFGEEVFIDVIDQLNSQPFFIFAAKLCPPDVEASMFALFMGLSNFGSDAGKYLGSSMLKLFGGVSKPDYDGIATYCLLKSLMRLLPLMLVPLLVPAGSPAGTAVAMGAGKGVTSNDIEGNAENTASVSGSPAEGDDTKPLRLGRLGQLAEASYGSSLPPEFVGSTLSDNRDIKVQDDFELRTVSASPSTTNNELHFRAK